MSDVYEHNPGDHEDPLAGPLWIVGLLGAVLLIVIMLGLTALFYNARHQEDAEKVIKRDPDELLHLRQAQQQRLTAAPHWEERKEGEQVVQSLVIPIEQAMAAMAREGAKK